LAQAVFGPSRNRVQLPRWHIMGCSSSTLSLASILLGSKSDEQAFIESLCEATVLDLVESSALGEKRFSVGSRTDLKHATFANKDIQTTGDEFTPDKCGLGYTCRKGLKLRPQPNQDSWSILRVNSLFSIYGVYDGHGRNGHDVSNFVRDALPKLIVRGMRLKDNNVTQLLRDSFQKTQQLIATLDQGGSLDAQLSGSTATIAVHDHVQQKLILAHVADSSAVLGRWHHREGTTGSHGVEAVPLTRDHKPALEGERARIERRGGRVLLDGRAQHRVYARNARSPGINMSRCLGDLIGHRTCGLIAEPDVFELQLEPHDQVLLVCSDGVWEFVTPSEAVKLVSYYTPAQAMIAAERLAKLARDRWVVAEGGTVVDDITVVLVYLRAARQSSRPCPGTRTLASRACVRTRGSRDRLTRSMDIMDIRGTRSMELKGTRGISSAKLGQGQRQVPQCGARQPR